MVTSNLDTRDEILPSEKAYAYRMLRDAEEGSEASAMKAEEVGRQTKGKDAKRYCKERETH